MFNTKIMAKYGKFINNPVKPKYEITTYFSDGIKQKTKVVEELFIPSSWEWLKQESSKNLDTYSTNNGNIVTIKQIF